MTDKLKPCPFCGGTDLEFTHDVMMPDEWYAGWINCCNERCEVKGPDVSWFDSANEAETAAIQAWNQRANNGG
ncbi:Lar family restriction alleviation protein [Xenorhabdus entomophaga]|uniref:Lar family restriction alleviation protein n=1 Tax=Xenorhabdus entomophaga TaxID=3136257 RepID=UPI0030F488F3